MPKKPKQNKRQAILDAMLDVVVEGGFHDAPMSVIAQRAGASTGVIYHHFAGKQQIIEALYAQVYELKLVSFLHGYSPQMDARTAFVHVWLNLYRFHRRYARQMRFLEQYRLAGFDCTPAAVSPNAEALAFERRFRPKSKGGVLADWAPEVLQELTSNLVVRLAQHPRKLSTEVLHTLAEKMWEAVKAD